MSADLPLLRALFEQARALPPAAQRDFLAAHCADAVLRAHVERLLAADASDGDGPLARDPAALARDLGESTMTAPPLGPGQCIGPWRLEALIGEGGSSAVFRAARDSDGVRQEVALKLLRRGVYTPEAQRQFRRERQALAQLRHPGIARLVEGGVTVAGQAYIAMELVDGLPITEHARAQRLDLRARLRLFLAVCRAVEAAHRALIVHRDLKPANVLVSHDGSVKLLDFGIAKLLDADDETRTLLQAFTPAYAAPEQRQGGAISTATDVYALGVLLGELVTGQRLGDGHGRTPSSRITRTADPTLLPAPPPQLRRALRGDLDNIVLKAIDADPERRYASATALADDIAAFLDGRPVAAHAPSRRYRLAKFVRRHRLGVAGTAAFLLALVAALGLALAQARIARQEARRANTVRDFLVSLFDAARAHLPRDARPTPEALVDQARAQLAATRNLDAATRADLARTLGEVELSLADFASAQALFADALQALPADAPDAGAAALHVLHADAQQRAGRNAEADAEVQAALPPLRRAPSPLLLRALGVRAAAQMQLGRPEAALELRREAAQWAATLHGADSTEALAAAFGVGHSLVEAERPAEAVALLEPLLARWRARAAPEDDRYVAALSSLATAADSLGDVPASVAHYRELLALKRRIYRPPHDAIAATLRDLALVVARTEKYAEAEALLDEALAMQQQVFGPAHREIAATLDARGGLRVAQRRFAEADADYRAAIAACEAASVRDEVCARAHNNLGMSLYRQDRLDAAEAVMRQALAARRALFGDAHPSVAYSLSTLANVAVRRGDGAAAVRLGGEALAVLDQAGRAASREAALIRHGYAQALWSVGRHAEALAEIDRALADWQRVAPESTTRRVGMLAQKAQIQQALGQEDAARQTVREARAAGVPADELPPRTRQVLQAVDAEAAGGRD